jgi:HPt (histidine-containing phosphotransfer) domain-containing protein
MSSAVVFDRAQALERLGGDEELLDSVASLFVEESTIYRRALGDALDSGDPATVQREAHTVKSVFATFSFESGRELAFRLEQLAAAGNLNGADVLTAELLAAIDVLAAALKA